MQYFLLKLLPILLVYFSMFAKEIHCQTGETGPNVSVNSVVKNENYLMFGKNLDQETIINNDIHVFTQNSPTTTGYVFYPAPRYKKCFSFQIRTTATATPQILLSATPLIVVSQGLEVILEFNGKLTIRTKYNTIVSTALIKGLINDRELRGFWIRWLDDYLLEFGRDTDNYPILSYRLPEKISVNFIAILSEKNSAEWILHQDPQCGGYNISCTKELNSEKINFLQKFQQHILHQIKIQHGISKLNSLPSKEILLKYEQSIEKLYRKAEENQNQIYAEDTEIYTPLKSITFDEITQEFWKFMAELEMELAKFKQT